MAATVLTIRDLGTVGVLDLVAVEQALDAADGATFANDGDTYVLLRNAGAGVHVVTVTTPRTVGGGLAVADPTFSIAAGKSAILPAFDPNYYNDSDGNVDFTCDGTKTEVKAVAFQR